MAGSLSPHPLSISSFLNPKPQCQVTNRPIFGTFLPSMRNRNFFFPLPPRLSRVTDNPNPFRACRAVTTWHKPARSHFGCMKRDKQDSRKKEREKSVGRTSLKGSGDRPPVPTIGPERNARFLRFLHPLTTQTERV